MAVRRIDRSFLGLGRNLGFVTAEGRSQQIQASDVLQVTADADRYDPLPHYGMRLVAPAAPVGQHASAFVEVPLNVTITDIRIGINEGSGQFLVHRRPFVGAAPVTIPLAITDSTLSACTGDVLALLAANVPLAAGAIQPAFGSLNSIPPVRGPTQLHITNFAAATDINGISFFWREVREVGT